MIICFGQDNSTKLPVFVRDILSRKCERVRFNIHAKLFTLEEADYLLQVFFKIKFRQVLNSVFSSTGKEDYFLCLHVCRTNECSCRGIQIRDNLYWVSTI